MSEYHVKFIASDNGGPRYEHVIKDYEGVAALEGFEVFSALFGDGKGRYADVTNIVRAWGRFWPDNWKEILHGPPEAVAGSVKADDYAPDGLVIHSARYGVSEDEHLDVTEHLRALVKNDSLDIVVNNSTLTPNQNPYRGKRKALSVVYSYDGGEPMTIQRDEKDWLIIGQPQPRELTLEERSRHLNLLLATGPEGRETLLGQPVGNPAPVETEASVVAQLGTNTETPVRVDANMLNPPPMSVTALNDYLIRKFSISPQRLKAPMPIELRDFHRNDLAQLFAELRFKRGAEIGVAEGNYSEVLLKANPECELLLVDPWHHYSDNPQGKSKERHEFAYNETLRKTEGYNVKFVARHSMDAVFEVGNDSLDFCYIDGNHLFDYVMQDLIEWSKRVRSGGVVSGDDYYQLDQKRWIGGGVVEAVQAYTDAHQIPIWYIFAGHKSVDFMWCKP